MAGAFGRPSAVVQTAAEERLRSDALARRITVADPHPVEAPPPAGQRVIAGYRLARTFSDVVKGRHRIFRVGTVLTDKAEVERLARAGAELDPVEPDQAE